MQSARNEERLQVMAEIDKRWQVPNLVCCLFQTWATAMGDTNTKPTTRSKSKNNAKVH